MLAPGVTVRLKASPRWILAGVGAGHRRRRPK